MAVCLDDDDVWACARHPSKRRRSGVCPICLHERLAALCPDCAHVLPCACSALAPSPSSSSSSSSFSLFSYSVSGSGGGDVPLAGIGSVGRVASLIECEPAFRRSRSMAIPFPRTNNPDPVAYGGSGLESDRGGSKMASFWRLFKRNRGDTKTTAMMRKSRSVAVSSAGAGESRFSAAATSRGKIWYFPSPIKVFRQSRVSKMVFQQQSPLYRG